MQIVPSKSEGETVTAPNSDRGDAAAQPEDSGKTPHGRPYACHIGQYAQLFTRRLSLQLTITLS